MFSTVTTLPAMIPAWLSQGVADSLFPHMSVIMHDILILMSVAMLGLAIGRIKIRGVSIGIAGVLFTGLFFGHFGWNINGDVLTFIQEFGLMLFVYSIGAQVGPSFFHTLKTQGLSMTLVGTVGVAVDCLLVVFFVLVLKFPIDQSIGVYCGALTNTPALGAAQQTLQELNGVPVSTPGLGYAVCYPFGVLGIIMVFLILRVIFRIDLATAKRDYDEKTGLNKKKKLANTDIEIDGHLSKEEIQDAFKDIPVKVSRILHAGEIRLGGAADDIDFTKTEAIHLVGEEDDLRYLEGRIGKRIDTDLLKMESDLTSCEITVSENHLVGKPIEKLKCIKNKSVVITRLIRIGLEFAPTDDMKLNFGDHLRIVGSEKALAAAAKELGNAPQKLEQTQLIPVLVGIAIGVFLGNIGIPIPGLLAPLKLGLAGGVLVASILLSYINRIGPLVWYMPTAANFILRELGIVLFLGCVGLKAGGRFVETLMQGPGLEWFGLGVIMTVTSMTLVGCFCLKVLKMNYLTLVGFLAGTHTNPPALAYSSGLVNSDAAAYGYATFYPMAMLLRVLTAQLLVLVLFIK